MNVAAEKSTDRGNKPLGVLAEFPTAADLIAAAVDMRKKGYQELDAFSPFPLHGIDQALGVRPSPLGWLVLVAGVVGGVSAIAFQWWTNAVDYPFLISGKPRFSLPANIPVTFEVIILAAAFAAFFGMLFLNGLPRLANPLFRSERFRKATNDGFFLFVAANDANFDRAVVKDLLRCAHAKHVELLAPDEEASQLPRGFLLAGVVLGTLALLPPVMIASVRGTTSDKPRLHNFFDMDFQPKFKSQTTSPLFADGRSMRPPVAGTVARGRLQEDAVFFRGMQPGPPPEAGSATRNGSLTTDERIAENDLATTGTLLADEPLVAVSLHETASDKSHWVTEIPLPATVEMMERGRERFNIHCAICHGRAGMGNGLASQRALELEQGTWLPPTSIHADHVREQPVGQLFHTISHGVRKMPAYGHQIVPEDRWAIVMYLRALQRSQHASIEDVPEEIRPTLREMN